MKKIKKISTIILICIITLILASFMYSLGYNIEGNLRERVEYIIKEKGLDSKKLRERGYNLILIDNKKETEKKTIPNTKLEIKKGSISKNGIILEYNTKDEVYGSNVDTREYILERKIGDKWYSVEPIKEKVEDNFNISNIERILMNTDIEYFKDFSEYTNKGLPNGIYRIGFVSKINFEKYYIMKEFEIK